MKRIAKKYLLPLLLALLLVLSAAVFATALTMGVAGAVALAAEDDGSAGDGDDGDSPGGDDDPAPDPGDDPAPDPPGGDDDAPIAGPDDNPFGDWDDSDDPVAGPDGILQEDADDDDDDDADSDEDDEEEEDPLVDDGTVLISTADDLNALARAVNNGAFEQTYGVEISSALIRLTGDISLGGNFTPIGSAFYAFVGEFDGAGFTISGLTVKNENDTCQGLFGVIGKGGYVHDLSLANAHVSGFAYVGGIAGVIEFARIENCSVSGTITATDSLAGGIAGVAIESSIINCSTSGSVSADIENAGGIAGMAAYNKGSIQSCSSSMSVTVMWGAGGISGNATNAKISGCKFSGSLESQSQAEGNMVGEVMSVDTAGATIEPVFDSEESEGGDDE